MPFQKFPSNKRMVGPCPMIIPSLRRPAIHEARSLTGCDTTPQAAGFHGTLRYDVAENPTSMEAFDEKNQRKKMDSPLLCFTTGGYTG